MTEFTTGEFNQAVSDAKRAAAQGPVVTTDGGEPSFEDYPHLNQSCMEALLTRLQMDEEDYPEEIDLTPGYFGAKIPEF